LCTVQVGGREERRSSMMEFEGINTNPFLTHRVSVRGSEISESKRHTTSIFGTGVGEAVETTDLGKRQTTSQVGLIHRSPWPKACHALWTHRSPNPCLLHVIRQRRPTFESERRTSNRKRRSPAFSTKKVLFFHRGLFNVDLPCNLASFFSHPNQATTGGFASPFSRARRETDPSRNLAYPTRHWSRRNTGEACQLRQGWPTFC
jgi:hypothetical protein